MRNLRSSALLLAVVVGGPTTMATAQDAAEATPEVAVQAQSSISGDEQATQAAAIEANGQALAARLQKMLDAARKSGDIIKVTCLNDKLTQANANVKSVKQRKEALGRALAVGEQDAANHEYTVLTVLGQKSASLEQEAGQCLGQDMYESGAAQTVTEVDDDTPTDDPAVLPPLTPLPTAITIPPPLSPSM